MDMIGRIRRLHRRGKKSVREIARMTGLSRNTISKWLEAPIEAAPKYQRSATTTKLEPFHETLRQALKADARRPKHERRTARALYSEIRAAGYDGGYTRVTDFLRAWRLGEGQSVATTAFVPLTFELGEAFQFDWSEEGLVVGGIYYRLQVSHMKLCASRAFWLVAYPSLRGAGRRRAARHLRQHEDRGRQGQEGQGPRGQRALRGDVRALPVRRRLLQRRFGLGEGRRREERAGQPAAHLDRSGQAALRIVRRTQCLAGAALPRVVGRGAAP
jgi:transposase